MFEDLIRFLQPLSRVLVAKENLPSHLHLCVTVPRDLYEGTARQHLVMGIWESKDAPGGRKAPYDFRDSASWATPI